MRRMLLTTVAVIPLVAASVWTATSQETNRQQGVSQSQGAGKSEQGASKGQSSGAQERTQGRAQSGGANERNIGQGQSKQGEANKGTGGRNEVTQGQSNGREDAEQQTRGQDGQNERTTGQTGNQPQNPHEQTKGRQPNANQPNANVHNQRSQQNPKGQRGTTGQNQEPNANVQNQRPQQNPKGQHGTTGQNQRQEPNANVQNQPQPNQPNAAEQNRTSGGENLRQEQTGAEGNVRGNVTVTDQQRTKIQQTVLSGRDVPREDRVDFALKAGVEVPTRVRVKGVPRELIEIHPEWRGNDYFVVHDDIVIVDRNHRIVSMVPVGSRSSSVETQGTSTETRGTTASFESPEQIREIQQVLIEKGFYHGRVDGVMGRETMQAIMIFQRQEGIQASGRVDERTMTALGVSGSTQGQGGAQGEPNANAPGQHGGNQPSAGPTTGQGRNQPQGGNQPSANPSTGQSNRGGTTGQGGNRPSANPRGGNQPSATPGSQPGTGGQTPDQPAQNRQQQNRQ